MADVVNDRFDDLLSAQLRAYADRRVRPFEPMAIAQAALAPMAGRRLPWRREASGRGRALAFAFVAGIVVLAGGLLAAGWTRTPSPQPTPSASPGPVPTARADALLAGDWFLDFTSSGLDGHVNPDLPGEIGALLRFSHGGWFGGMGYGGGCATYEGTFSAALAAPSALGGELRFVFTALNQGCGEGTPQRVVEDLVGARRFVLMDCAPVPGASDAEDLRCRTLRIGDDVDTNVLVYRREPAR